MMIEQQCEKSGEYNFAQAVTSQQTQRQNGVNLLLCIYWVFLNCDSKHVGGGALMCIFPHCILFLF